MADILQLRGGTTAENDLFTGSPREITADTDKNTLRVHDGVTAGGAELARTEDVESAVENLLDTVSLGSNPGINVLGDSRNGFTLDPQYGNTAGTIAEGNDVRIVKALQRDANLAELTDPEAARNHLQLGSAAVANVGQNQYADNNEVVLGDDVRLSNARTPTGVAGGVLDGNYPNPSFRDPMVTAAVMNQALDNKVDKVFGMGLSDENFTLIFKHQLEELATKHYVGMAEFLQKLATKLDSSALSASVTYFMTSALSDVPTYTRLVTDAHSPNFNPSGEVVESVEIDPSGTTIGRFISDGFVDARHVDNLSITLISEIRKSAVTTADATVYFEVWKRDSLNDEILLGTSNCVPITLATYVDAHLNVLIPHVEFNVDDRIVLKVYGDKLGAGINPKLKYKIGGNNPARLLVPLPVEVILPTMALVATSGEYDDLLNKPDLKPVATSGDYNDLDNLPYIPPRPDTVLPLDAIEGTSITVFSWTPERVHQAAYAAIDAVVSDAGKSGSFNDLLDKPIIGVNGDTAIAGEILPEGSFVNMYIDGGIVKYRLADAELNRPADGFVLDTFGIGDAATIYPLIYNNTKLNGLVEEDTYFLGSNGTVTNVPYSSIDPQNDGFIIQKLGKAKSDTTLIVGNFNHYIL